MFPLLIIVCKDYDFYAKIVFQKKNVEF